MRPYYKSLSCTVRLDTSPPIGNQQASRFANWRRLSPICSCPDMAGRSMVRR